ncbi:Uncharacterised protein [Mycobacteroides abscessus subsp. abscessus]|nr:Uncharacterised protein [Mycobacteroides abscessus subsp. abscessus]
MPFQHRHPAVHFLQNPAGDGFVLVGNDHRTSCGVGAFLHKIDHPGTYEHGNKGVHGFLVGQIENER